MSASSIPGINAECPVCFEAFDSVSIIPYAGSCLHNICKPCWDDLKIKKCPRCTDHVLTAVKNCDYLDLVNQTTQLISGQIPDISQQKTALELAVYKATQFLANEWPQTSLYAGKLTPTDMDLLWNEQPHFAERVTSKIYVRLCEFPTYRCRAMEELGQETAICKYNMLCHLLARPKAVQERNPVALFCEGHCLFHGIFRPKDIKTALEFFKEADENGLALATHQVGVCLYEGYGVKIDVKAAIKRFRTAYKQGCLESATYLGLCFISGHGVKRSDSRKGIELWNSAADDGDVNAMLYLGDYYSQREKNYLGNSIPNLDNAIHWYEAAAERGVKRAVAEKERCQQLKLTGRDGSQENCSIQ
jgi:TPR repeat protein